MMFSFEEVDVLTDYPTGDCRIWNLSSFTRLEFMGQVVLLPKVSWRS